MRILMSDDGNVAQTLPLAVHFGVGIEIQEYSRAENLDERADEAAAIGRLIKDMPLRGFHAPFADLVPASKDRKIREVVRQRLESAYVAARQVGAQHYVAHTGYIPKTGPRDAWLDRSLGFWVEFLSSKPGDIPVHLENVYEDDFTLINELLDRVNGALGRECLTACLDIGHANSNSSHSLEAWIKGLGGRIRYVHLHNNGGALDDHWGLWHGSIDVARVLSLLAQHAPQSHWMVECIHPEMEQSLQWLKDHGY